MFVAIIFLFILLVVVVPEKRVLYYYSKAFEIFHRESLIDRGERLAHWMGHYSPGAVGFNLDCELPERTIYKGYGNELHYLWEQVRVFGGGLKLPLKSLRELLRRDIKFEKSKNSTLNGAFAQIGVMLLLSWSYLGAFIYLEITTTNWELIGLIGLWQCFGAIAYIAFIRATEKKYFAASRYFLRFVTKMTVIANSHGELSKVEVPTYFGKLCKNESVVYAKLECLVVNARERGELKKESIGELEDEYWFCLGQKIESFLSLLKKTSFIWSALFILPSLFVTTMFSFSEIMANNI